MPSSEISALYAQAHELRAELARPNLEQQQKLMAYLDTFYRGRDVPFDTRLIILASEGPGKIISQGAYSQQIRSPDTKQNKLAEYQREMKAFASFLKNGFLSGTLQQAK